MSIWQSAEVIKNIQKKGTWQTKEESSQLSIDRE